MPCWAGLLVAPRVFRAPEAPAAREARASLRSAPRLEARPCPPVPPAPSTPVVPGVLRRSTSSRSPARPRRHPLAPRPSPATAHGHRSQALQFPPAPSTPATPGVLTCGSVRRPEVQLWLSISNFARNSSMTHSNIAFVSLELQRFWGISKNDRDKLRATFGWWCRRRLSKPAPAAHGRRSRALLYPQVPPVPPYRYASTFMKVLVMARPTPDREDSTPSDRVESSR